MNNLSKVGARIIIHLRNNSFKNNYSSLICKELSITYSYSVYMVNYLKKIGLITLDKKKNRKRYIHLTKKGKELSEKLVLLQKLMK